MSLTTTSGAGALLPTSVSEAVTLAKMMSDGDMLPKEFKGKPANVLMVIELAMRFGMSPFAMTQEVSVVQGKLMLSGKIAAAALHSSGVLAGRLTYAYEGTGADRQVTVSGTLRGEDRPRCVVVRLSDAKTANQMWSKQPDQQLAYHGARVWGRRHAPEVLLGVYSPEEMEVQPGGQHSIDGVAEEISAPTGGKLDAIEQALGSPTLDAQPHREPQPAAPQERDDGWIDGPPPHPGISAPQPPDPDRSNAIRFIGRIRGCNSTDELVDFNRGDQVKSYRAWVKANRPDLHTMIQDAEGARYQALVEAQQGSSAA